MTLLELAPEVAERPASTASANAPAVPTAKYRAYLAEVEAALPAARGTERARLEGELALLRRASFVALDGVVHHYIDAGPRAGTPLLLIHGWDCSSYWWHHVIDPLAEAGYRVIAYDLRGHGFSEGHGDDYSVAALARDLRALSAALELGPQHLAAFSLGAFVALHYASEHPEQVRSLQFFNFGLLPYNKFASWLLPRMLNVVFNKVLRPLHRHWRVPYYYARTVLARNTPSVADVRLGVLSLRFTDAEAALLSSSSLAERESLEAVPRQMRQVTVPTLLVAGAGDPIMPPSIGRELMALAPNGSFFEMPRCGHLILFELPEQVVTLMRLHLARG
jgi:pimeloyl-ACP methyl ester carboxylesterase